MPDSPAAANLVEYAVQDHVATITLNRPEKLNAFSDELVIALGDAFRRLDLDEDAWVGVVHGKGRAFSTGADVNQRQLRSREEFIRLGGPQGRGANSADLYAQAVNWKPIISAAHGYVMGLAVGVFFEADLTVAEAGTKFQITETGRGLSGARYWGILQQRGGGALVNDVALTGRFFTAEECDAAGLLNRLAAPGTLLETAHDLAREVCKVPPLSVRSVVRSRRWYMDRLSREILMQIAPLKLYLSEDFQESARAFVEKRKPNPYKGR
ncbi:MAG TPA: enoyl-CoA hydratase/isomerase family protein [Candidatus Sulfotelmatobacter sp.]|nr:enoyl-CoA hydratase/isomerase family protein [Candidatus Sulfotelmatobacter sp.]